jgi:hypothetical protein
MLREKWFLGECTNKAHGAAIDYCHHLRSELESAQSTIAELTATVERLTTLAHHLRGRLRAANIR